MDKIEALALCIASVSGAFTPGSEAMRLNNPGLLRAFSMRVEAEDGLRKFGSWYAGFKALCFDLQTKCSGKSRAHIAAESPLKDLLKLWDIRSCHGQVNFLRRAIDDAAITDETPLSYFVR
ncbi:MAG TPA: hypothetical protein VHU83_06630 [Bryobacteraceae bacterium]|jgi:hypothetical protein|nr:hypothetical protein [Bryobacteraceae bacterium]